MAHKRVPPNDSVHSISMGRQDNCSLFPRCLGCARSFWRLASDNSWLESYDEALGQRLKELGLPEGDLFRSQNDFIVEAYNRRGREIAYTDRDQLLEEQLFEVQR
jgi:hypothetical protein